jgi:hypothetical protein
MSTPLTPNEAAQLVTTPGEVKVLDMLGTVLEDVATNKQKLSVIWTDLQAIKAKLGV